MKKLVHCFLVMLLITVLSPTNVKAATVTNPLLEPQKYIVTYSYFNSGYSGMLKPEYRFQFNDSRYIGVMIELYEHNYRYWNSGEGFDGSDIAEIYRTQAQHMFQIEMNDANMIALTKASTLGVPPVDMSYTYQVVRIPKGGGVDKFFRTAYRKGDKILYKDENGKECIFVVPEDEKALFYTGTINGVYYDHVMWSLTGCGNTAIPLQINKKVIIEESDEKYSKTPIPTKKEDTVYLPYPGQQQQQQLSQSNQPTIIFMPAPAAPAAPAQPTYVPPTPQVTTEKRRFHDTFLGGVTESFIGGGLANLATYAILPKNKVVYQNNNGYYSGGYNNGGFTPVNPGGGPVQPISGYGNVSSTNGTGFTPVGNVNNGGFTPVRSGGFNYGNPN